MSSDPLTLDGEGGSPLAPRPWLAVATLSGRELLRFFRQPNRIVGAVGTPVLFWLLFGTGLQRSFRIGDAADGPTFLQYYFPGTLVLILMFTAIFTTISVIEDRREGFLQSVLVAPIPRWTMVLGKVLGGSLIALLQGLLFLLLALMLPVELTVPALLALVLALWIAALALTSLGLAIAWQMDSTQGFHAIMNLVLMPMWLLSGAFFPAPSPSGAADLGQQVIHWAIRLNPLTYVVAAVRHLLYTPRADSEFWLPAAGTSWVVTIAFAMVAFLLAWLLAGQRSRGDLL